MPIPVRIGKFRGGIHPHDAKERTRDIPIQDFPPPKQAVIPVSQHLGAPAAASVKKGDPVKKGQLIAQAQGFVSACVHASISGTVSKVGAGIFPAARRFDSIVIDSDGADGAAEPVGEPMDPEKVTPDELRDRIAKAGIVGMGGATFPAVVKLKPPPNKPIDLVVLNGVECEPYLTADHRLMLEEPRRILEGLQIIRRIVGAAAGVVAIEANKPDAAETMRRAISEMKIARVDVAVLPVRYPQGGEKQLIKALTGREVPSGAAGTADTGVLVHNVATAHAIARAVFEGMPLIERIVTVTGDAVPKPANLRVRIGTPIGALLDFCGVRDASRVILGGPMMGPAATSLTVPIAKGTSGVLVLSDPAHFEDGPCIRCGRCVEACPIGLQPSVLSILVQRERMDELESNRAMDCIECGACTFVCPAGRRIVHAIRLGKSVVMEKIRARQEKERAEKAAAAKAAGSGAAAAGGQPCAAGKDSGKG